MENTDAEQQPTPEQAQIIERLRLMQAEVDAVKTDLVAKLQESREQVDSLFRELSKVRDELITSKTERRVLSRWYDDAKGERDKLHSELVEVRSALADVSAERDSLRTTLAAWEAADTTPFVKVPDVADHVMPPVLDRGEPDPANDERDAKLEFRNIVPTPEMIAYVQWWDVPEGNTSICFKHLTQKPVVWRRAGDNGDERWQYEDCPQPLKPHGMTWQQLDAVLASKKAAESRADPVSDSDVSLCDKCHGCGHTLSRIRTHAECLNEECDLDSTYGPSDISPYYGPCRSEQQVRHE